MGWVMGWATYVLLLLCALLAVVGVGDALAAADDAAALVAAVVALVADAHQRARPHVRVADDALAIALLAQSPDGCVVGLWGGGPAPRQCTYQRPVVLSCTSHGRMDLLHTRSATFGGLASSLPTLCLRWWCSEAFGERRASVD
jgi:hypothetical protein